MCTLNLKLTPDIIYSNMIICQHLVGKYKGEAKLLGCSGKILGIAGEVANELVTIECSTSKCLYSLIVTVLPTGFRLEGAECGKDASGLASIVQGWFYG